MIQRYVYEAIVRGLKAYREDPSLFMTLFGGVYDLSETEVSKIVSLFAKGMPHVQHGFDHRAPTFPQYLILLQSETQPSFALGDYGGPAAVGVGPGGQQLPLGVNISSLWTHNIQIVSESREVNTTIYMHEMLKSILMAAKPYFQAHHIDIVTMQGTEFDKEGDKHPELIFRRGMNFRCWREFKQKDIDNSLFQAFKVVGMHRPADQAPPSLFQLASTYTPDPFPQRPPGA